MPAGDQQPVELLRDAEAWQDEPVRLATALGHSVVADGVRHERYTCTACGRAVQRVGTNIYGSATTDECSGVVL